MEVLPHLPIAEKYLIELLNATLLFITLDLDSKVVFHKEF